MKKFAISLVSLLVVASLSSNVAYGQSIDKGSSPSFEQRDLQENKVDQDATQENIEELFDQPKNFVKQELVLKFKDDTPTSVKSTLLQQFKLEDVSSLLEDQYMLVQIPKEGNLRSIAEKLSASQDIEYVEPNLQIHKQFVPSDSEYKRQWHLNTIGAPKAWDTTKGSSDVIVAVVDGGVQQDHPDLKERIVSPINMVSPNKSYENDIHGTHVAGIISAAINNFGTIGVAPHTKIMPINVFQSGKSNSFIVAEGIEYAANHGANIINLSLGLEVESKAIEAAIQYAASKGITIIAAAGNKHSNQPTYPASYNNVIAVSATDSNDQITSFSNYGSYIDVAAPGKGIFSTSIKSQYQYMDGTSMASPIVAGIAGLILAENPFLTGKEVETILKKTALDLGSSGWDSYFGAGRVQANQALQMARDYSPSLTMPNSFVIYKNNKMNLSIPVPAKTVVSVGIEDAKGNTVKKLFSERKWNGGKLNLSWDGKSDYGAYVIDGKYVLSIQMTLNNQLEEIKKEVNVQNSFGKILVAPNKTYYSPSVQEKMQVPLSINENVKVTAKLVDSKQRSVKVLWNNASISKGSRTIGWDGKNQKGKKVSAGTYKLVFTTIDNKKKRTTSFVNVYIDETAPIIKIGTMSLISNSEVKEHRTIAFTLNEDALVTAQILSPTGKVVKELSENQFYSTGNQSNHWESVMDVPPGMYQLELIAKDLAGNSRTVRNALQIS
ncbi:MULTISPECIES: S8 family serine peptidase [Bacillus]|uniref:S8 family serine peptidase n=1 Tax=Bacillus TaxID=1386 RepID=UPI000303F393|nr:MULTISPECIES: S8 family serine peptidase [Bacillus]